MALNGIDIASWQAGSTFSCAMRFCSDQGDRRDRLRKSGLRQEPTAGENSREMPRNLPLCQRWKHSGGSRVLLRKSGNRLGEAMLVLTGKQETTLLSVIAISPGVKDG